jgi:C1A family cysteine protease
MKKTLLFLLVAVFFSIVVRGQNFVSVTKSNNGQTINLSADQVLEVKLPRTPSNGYVWCLSNVAGNKEIQRSITQIGDGDFISARTTANGKVLVGQSGTQIIRYIGTLQGTTVLSMELIRPWENNSPSIDNFTITVISGGKYTGSYIAPVAKKPNHVTSTSKSTPSKWDWRSQCTPIANQMSCGDCWAFAGVGAFECNIKIHDGVTRDISEAYLTNCDNDLDFAGCGGGWCPLNYWLAPKGAVYESDSPWTTSLGNGTTGTCIPPYPFHETIDSYAVVPGESPVDSIPPDINMKDAIYNYGPIWVTIDASGNAFSNYSNGIFTGSGGITNHAVVLVGWVDSASVSGGGYWILRNSWGSSWGMNGYMYISYGSAQVGCFANYIVYKGGTLHDLPPVASFGASSTSSCTGTIQFIDSSFNAPTSWHWDFGDGTTSVLESPLHTYNANGTYSVNLKATNTFGNDSVTKSSFITINMPAAPTTTGASHSGPGSMTLSASGSGTLNWYDAATDGNLVNTGTTFITPVLTTSTTYYVEDAIMQAIQNAGIPSSALSAVTGGYYTSTATQGEIFDALAPVTIKSVTVYANTTGNRTIYLKSSAGAVLDSLTTNIASGMHDVTLNFDVPSGNGYILACSSNNNLWREKSGAIYPYTLSNVISITGNTAGSAGYYYYFYNWQVQKQSCLSPRTPVTATISVGIDEFVESNISVYPDPSDGEFTIAFDNGSREMNKISIENAIGQEVFTENILTTTYKKTFNFSDLPKGIYIINLAGTERTLYKEMVIK